MKKIVLLTALLCLLIAFQSVFAADYVKPQKVKNTFYYDGTNQTLVTAGQGRSGDEVFYFRLNNSSWMKYDAKSLVGHFPGKYTVDYCLDQTDKTSDICKGSDVKGSITIEIKEYKQPTKRTGLKYDGSEQILINPGTALVDDVYYYRDPYTGDWGTDLPEQKGPGTFTAEYILVHKDTFPSKNVKGKYITGITISGKGYNPSSDNSGSSNHTTFYNVGDGTALFDSGRNLPATGFPTRISKPLSIKPDSVLYEDLSMRIQIPSISVDVELTGVPVIGDTWAVEWLGNEAGMLSGSAMPGEGYTMVAAHNHLNTQEIGPFGFLFDLDENDRIFVNMPDGDLKIYSVYANELLEPNDFTQIASISENEEGSLILVTCENEMTDGNYQNRRVVFAKLMN